MALEDLGNLILTVGGDLSPLEQTLANVPQVAQQAADELDAALSGGLDSATQSIQNLNTAITNIQPPAGLEEFNNSVHGTGEAAGGATPKLEELGHAEHDAGEAAHEAENSMKEMAETILRLGEALLVAEGLKEFAEEAIGAYDAVQRFSIAMETLTGDADIAEEKIGELKNMALSDALSFPSLLQAQTRMTALGLSAEQSSQALQMAADAAATMNTSFDDTVNKIDRMVTSGSVMPRMLASMGISAENLAKVMGVSVHDITADFKLLDEGTRLDALNAAMASMAGAAEKMATTVTGQLQKMKIAWDLAVNEGMGASLANALQPIVEFINTEFIPAMGELVNWFTGLSEPTKEFAISLAALGVAAGLAAAAIGAVGLVLAPVSPILLALGAAAVVAASGLIAATDASPALQAAWKDLYHSAGELWASVKALGSDLPGLSPIFRDLGDALATPVEAIALLVHWFAQMLAQKAEIEGFFREILGVVAPVIAVIDKLISMTTGNKDWGISSLVQGFKDVAQNGAAAVKILADAELHTQGTAAAMGQVSAHTKAAAVEADELKAKVQAALKAAQDAAAAEQAKLDAIKLQNEAMKSMQQQMDQATKQAQTMATEIQKLPDSYERFVFTLGSGKDWLDKTDQAISKLQDQTHKLSAEAAAFAAQGTASGNIWASMLQNVIDKSNEEIAHLKAWRDAEADITTEAARLPPILILTVAEQKAVKEATKDSADELKNMLGQLPKAADLIGQMAPNTKAWDDAMKNLGITSDDVFKRSFGEGLQQMKQLIQSNLLSTEQLDQGWEHLLTKFKASADAQQQVLNLMQAENAPLQYQLQARENILNAQMKQAALEDQTGQSELAIAQHLTAIQLQMFALNQDTMGWANTWKAAMKDIGGAFDQLGGSIANAIVSGQNFGQAMTKIVDDVAKKILTDLIQGALDKLAASIIKNTLDFNAAFGAGGAIDQGLQHATQAFSQAGSSIASDMSEMSSAVAHDGEMLKGEFQSLGQTVQQSTTQAAQSTQAAAVSMSSSMTMIIGLMTALGAVVSAIAGIIGAIEQAHTNTLLGRIEENTRRMDITMEGQGIQSWVATAQNTSHLVDIWGAVNQLYNPLSDIDSNTQAMVVSLQKIADSGISVAGGGSGPPVTVSDRDVMTVIQQLGTNVIAELNRDTDVLRTAMEAEAGAVIAAIDTAEKDIVGAIQALATQTKQASGTVSASISLQVTPLTDISLDMKALVTQGQQTNTILTNIDKQITALADGLKGLGALLSGGGGTISVGGSSTPAVPVASTPSGTYAMPASGPGSTVDLGAQLTGLIQQVKDRFTPDEWGARLADSMTFMGLTSNMTAQQLIALSEKLPAAAPAPQTAPDFAVLSGPLGTFSTLLENTVQHFGDFGAQISDMGDVVQGTKEQVAAFQTAMQTEQANEKALADAASKVKAGFQDIGLAFDGITIAMNEFENGLYSAVGGFQALSPAMQDVANRTAMALINLPGYAAQQAAIAQSQTKSHVLTAADLTPSTAADVTAFQSYQQSLIQSQRGAQINITVNAGTVVGNGGMQQLAQTVGNQIVDNFRRAGMKF